MPTKVDLTARGVLLKVQGSDPVLGLGEGVGLW